MFVFRLYLSKLLGAFKFVFSPIVVFVVLGIPLIWALVQRKRLEILAAKNGWKLIRADDDRDKGKFKKKLNGILVEVWPKGAFGAQVLVNFTTIKAIEIERSGRRKDPLKKTRPFESGDTRFDAMFPLHRGREAEVKGLMEDPDNIRELVELRSRWMLAISRLEITRHYMLAYLGYGTPFAYYLPPRVLEPFCSEFSAVAARWDKALGSNGQKIDP